MRNLFAATGRGELRRTPGCREKESGQIHRITAITPQYLPRAPSEAYAGLPVFRCGWVFVLLQPERAGSAHHCHGCATWKCESARIPMKRVDSLRTLTQGQCAVGRTPWSAAGPLASLAIVPMNSCAILETHLPWTFLHHFYVAHPAGCLPLS